MKGDKSFLHSSIQSLTSIFRDLRLAIWESGGSSLYWKVFVLTKAEIDSKFS